MVTAWYSIQNNIRVFHDIRILMYSTFHLKVRDISIKLFKSTSLHGVLVCIVPSCVWPFSFRFVKPIGVGAVWSVERLPCSLFRLTDTSWIILNMHPVVPTRQPRNAIRIENGNLWMMGKSWIRSLLRSNSFKNFEFVSKFWDILDTKMTMRMTKMTSNTTEI